MLTKRSLLLILLFINKAVYSLYLKSGPVVKTESGLIEGTYYKTLNGRIVNAYLGVPFSEPPVGDLRFSPPAPVKSWSGIYNANASKLPCLQFNHLLLARKLNPIIGDEDCLYMNIYTPPNFENIKELMDVIVFIHGGSFMYGSCNGFFPKYLLDKNNFVFITAAYRLGPLGFLSTEDEIVPGNNGLKDQVMALRWINRNIIYFGGDPSRVTITGFSAGGASVHLHYLSPLSKGLFYKGISISGTALCPWAFTEEPKHKAIKLANSLNCPTNNTKLLIDCLREIPGNAILKKIEPLFLGWLYNPISPFGPTAEVNNTERFLSDHPYELLKLGKVHDFPWLTGFATEEGLYPASEFILNSILMQELKENFFEILPHILDYNVTIKSEREKNNLSKKIENFYLKEDLLSEKGKNSLIKMISDRMYINAIDKSVKLQSTKIQSPIYVYNFAYVGKYSFTDIFTGVRETVGVSHGDDLAYVLDAFFSITDTKNDTLMSNIMVNIWSSFVNSSAPTVIDRDINWKPVNKDNESSISYLFIRSIDVIKIVTNRNLGNNLFWNSLNYSQLVMN